MKFEHFTYVKKKDDKKKQYLLLVLKEDEKYIEGIDATKLSEKEVLVLMEIQKKYEHDLSPFVKSAYRKFIKENIIDADDISDQEQLPNIKQ